MKYWYFWQHYLMVCKETIEILRCNICDSCCFVVIFCATCLLMISVCSLLQTPVSGPVQCSWCETTTLTVSIVSFLLLFTFGPGSVSVTAHQQRENTAAPRQQNITNNSLQNVNNRRNRAGTRFILSDDTLTKTHVLLPSCGDKMPVWLIDFYHFTFLFYLFLFQTKHKRDKNNKI